MSRLINLRSPYFVKLQSEDEANKTLQSATLDVYIWTGTLANRPTTPTYSLSKSVLGSQQFVIFELSELARDQVDILFDGVTRSTEPVYINWESVKTYIQQIEPETESGLVFGLDGYLGHEEGLQGIENLFRIPSIEGGNVEEEDNVPGVIIRHVESRSRTGFDFLTNDTISFSSIVTDAAGATITTATYQWQFRANNTASFVNIPGATSPTYTITTSSLANVGDFRLMITVSGEQALSNFIRAQNVVSTGTCNPSISLSQGDPIVVGNSIGVTGDLVITCDPASAFREPVASDFMLPSEDGITVRDLLSGEITEPNDASWVTPSVVNINNYVPPADAATRGNEALLDTDASPFHDFDRWVLVADANAPIGSDATPLQAGDAFSSVRQIRERVGGANPEGAAARSALGTNTGDVRTLLLFSSPGNFIIGTTENIGRGNRGTVWRFTPSQAEGIIPMDSGPVRIIAGADSASIGLTFTGPRVTTVTFTTNAENSTGSSRDGTYYMDIVNSDGSSGTPFTMFLRQSSGPAINSVTTSPTDFTNIGGTATITVGGDLGATYTLEANSIYPNNMFGGGDWITNSALDTVSGTVPGTHTLTIPSNETNETRSVNIIGIGSDAGNRVVGTTITQEPDTSYLRIVENDLSFASADVRTSAGLTATVQANRPCQLEIVEGGDFFRLYTPGLIDFTNPRIGEAFVLTRTFMALNPVDAAVNVRVLDSNDLATPRTGRARVVYLDDPSVTVDEITFSQAGSTTATNFLQSSALSQISMARITTIALDEDLEATFRVNSNTTWDIASSSSLASFSESSGTGTATVTVTYSSAPPAGTTITLTDRTGRAADHVITVTQGTGFMPTDVVCLAPSALFGQDATVTVTSPNSGTRATTYTLTLVRFIGSPRNITFNPEIGIGTNATGVFTVPASTLDFVGSYRFEATATDDLTGFSGVSQGCALTVLANPLSSRELTISPQSIVLDEQGNTSSRVTIGGGQLNSTNTVSFVCSDPFTILGRSSGTFATGIVNPVTVSAPSYILDESRTGTVVFSHDNAIFTDGILMVTQEGAAPEGNDEEEEEGGGPRGGRLPDIPERPESQEDQ